MLSMRHFKGSPGPSITVLRLLMLEVWRRLDISTLVNFRCLIHCFPLSCNPRPFFALLVLDGVFLELWGCPLSYSSIFSIMCLPISWHSSPLLKILFRLLIWSLVDFRMLPVAVVSCNHTTTMMAEFARVSYTSCHWLPYHPPLGLTCNCWMQIKFLII
jgi:hypothetical protein